MRFFRGFAVFAGSLPTWAIAAEPKTPRAPQIERSKAEISPAQPQGAEILNVVATLPGAPVGAGRASPAVYPKPRTTP